MVAECGHTVLLVHLFPPRHLAAIQTWRRLAKTLGGWCPQRHCVSKKEKDCLLVPLVLLHSNGLAVGSFARAVRQRVGRVPGERCWHLCQYWVAVGSNSYVERTQQSKYATYSCVYCRHLISSAPRTVFGSWFGASHSAALPVSLGGPWLRRWLLQWARVVQHTYQSELRSCGGELSEGISSPPFWRLSYPPCGRHGAAVPAALSRQLRLQCLFTSVSRPTRIALAFGVTFSR